MILRKTLLLYALLFFHLITYGQPSNTIFKGEKLELNGEWNLVMNQFISYEQLANQTQAIKIAVPSTWNDVEWNGQKIGPYGYGTYYRSFIYDDSLQNKSLSIEIPEVSLSYKLFANDELISQVGKPATNKEESVSRLDYQIADFNVEAGNTITLIFHVSNYENASGGLWYAPTIDYQDKLERRGTINSALKLIILGCILLAGLFQLSVFIVRPTERFGFFFFLVCVSMSMMLVTRGNMTLMDLFPDTHWTTLKKTLYLAIILIGPVNALFLREVFKEFYHKNIINFITAVAIGLSLFILFVPVRLSYSIIPYYHAYNILLGSYLFFSLVRAALAGMFGAKFLIVGYICAFAAILHDMLSSNYVIQGYSFDMTHLGIMLYMLQLMFLLASRYLFALKGKEQLSNHLKKVNVELEDMVERRTKALRDKTDIIETKNAELEKAMKEKDHLMAVVAHDLKAPLSSIMGISEMMGTGLEGQNAEFNNMIKKVTVDGRAMIESLTELKVYEQDDYEVKPALFDLNEFFEHKKIAFEPTAAKKNIRLNSVLDAKNKMVSTDENILGRVIDNLLSNALKFTQAEGEVNFTMSLQDEKLRVIISDNGPGFSERDMAKVFQKFQRLSARPTAGESSTGLGLSIVKTLVELLGGSIDLKSEQGNGAKFSVSIPI